MNPNREGTQSNFELPAQPENNEAQKGLEKAPEAPAAKPEAAGKQSKQPALPVIPDDIPAADTPSIGLPADDDVTQNQTSFTHKAKDSDQIDPVWLNKAKAVISQTRNDPYEQKLQMSRVQAEYIQKRFNKQVKSDEK
jgi:hypothetical protein